MNYAMEIFAWDIPGEGKAVMSYSTTYDLVNDLKRIANKYIDEFAYTNRVKPGVCCYASRGVATVDIYRGEDLMVIIDIIRI